MKKHKILFASCVALFASICFLGCEQEVAEEFTQISEFKPAAGTYNFETTIEDKAENSEQMTFMTYSMKGNGTFVIEGTEDDSKVLQTYTSMSSTQIVKYSSEDYYNMTKELFTSSSENIECSFDDTNYTITIKQTATNADLESNSEEWTYSDYVSSVNNSDVEIEIYFSNKGNYKLIATGDSTTQVIILTLQ